MKLTIFSLGSFNIRFLAAWQTKGGSPPQLTCHEGEQSFQGTTTTTTFSWTWRWEWRPWRQWHSVDCQHPWQDAYYSSSAQDASFPGLTRTFCTLHFLTSTQDPTCPLTHPSINLSSCTKATCQQADQEMSCAKLVMLLALGCTSFPAPKAAGSSLRRVHPKPVLAPEVGR